ncbi:hypothetical protein C923_02023 [Plasmodium falciparum UGT5.1]|uniref:Erythrocyte membrane protein 1 n=1 Tax=Plasmodium falciparum UGT5.1 TaxID=1237627 RepID=W7JQV7_PLAFA|nr:hypothetical protein C923_02023 [Plasmodium falciparum UGT5.1]
MLPQGGGGRGGGEDGIDHTSAKNLLDSIGENVYNRFHTAALMYEKELHGRLSDATFPTRQGVEASRVSEPCHLDYRYHTNVTSTVIDPCADRSDVRFSDVHGGQCTYNRIKDSKKDDNKGACAPYRRLHVCDQNLEQIEPIKITNTHNLLVDVCQAAKYEGQSITRYYQRYRATYDDSPSQICTVLARSFADIGDIVRGKDLFRGYDDEEKKQRKKLEKNLKEIFTQIYNELTRTATSGKNGRAQIEARYKKDDDNYYQLREDWWALNRKDVWKALTCEASGTYFRKTCAGKERTETYYKCQCANTDVPTYFDYVPQYLRWFEEWAEDFCRIRKHKLENAITNCRGKDGTGNERYCSRNGYDCINTVRIQRNLVKDSECNDCYSSCTPFVKWIDNQKLEFLKQKEKYKKEIKETHDETTLKIGKTTINNLYVKEFYTELKKNYEDVEEFLKKLSKEGICQSEPQVEQGKANSVDFTKGPDDIFSHTEYCDPCPWCGLKDNKDGTWERKGESHVECPKKEEKIFNNTNTTPISILYPDSGNKTILQKYRNFCGKGDKKNEQIKEWQCHYEKTDKIDDCVLHDEKKGTSKETIMSYHPFFWKWVTEMLDDSIEWRKELDNCLKNGNKKCGNQKCEKPCGCFLKWVKQKKTEWGQIKIHFGKQDFGIPGGLLGEIPYDFILEGVLKLEELFKNIEKDYGNAEEIKHIKEIMAKKENQEAAGGSPDRKKKTTIDLLLEDEETEATKCLDTHKEKCKPQEQEGGGDVRADEPRDPEHSDTVDDDEDDDDDEDTEAAAKESEAEEEEAAKEVPGPSVTPSPPTQDTVEVCKIVANILTGEGNLNEACKQKYGGNNSRLGWKCIPSGATTSGESTTSGATAGSGSVCIPPRRRRLYVGKLEQWAKNYNTDKSQEDGTTGQSQNGESSGEAEGGGTVEQSSQQQQEQEQEQQQQQQQQLLQSRVAVSQTSNGQATLSAASTETPESSQLRDAQVELRDAFIQSAAVETFFLWHRYKKIKEKERQEEQKRQAENGGLDPFGAGVPGGEMQALPSGSGIPGAQAQLPGSKSDDNNPQTLLQSGIIPNDFLRLMFYTLGDYRDILFSGGNLASGNDVTSRSNDNLKHIVLNAGGDQKSRDEMQTIQKAISTYFSNSGKPSTSVKTHTSTSGKDPESWWNNNGEHIWNGMICALTYTDSEGKEQPPKQNDTLKSALLDNNNKPKNEYQYDKVVLKDDDDQSGPKNVSSTSGENKPTTLDSFIKRPPYFRYLEEWGETFCKERKKRLEKIKEECRGKGDGDKVCSGDGEDCLGNLPDDPSTVPTFYCPSCATPCGLYKRWIQRKSKEFEEQKSAYKQQKEKCQTQRNDGGPNNEGNGVCGIPEKGCDTAATFLQMLGSCKNNSEEGKKGDGNGVDKLDFDKPDETFRPATNCAPCSQFTVDCKNCNGGNTQWKCKDNKITANDIGSGGNSAEDIGMLVSDNCKSGNGFTGVLDECAGANIFEGIRKDEWECGKVCGYNVCKPKKVNGKQNDKNQIIIIRALFKRWLEYFLEDYNKIKKKLKPCMNSGEGSKCINGYDKKHKCVEQWIEKKRAEWEEIKKHYERQNENGDTDLKTLVSNLLSGLYPQTDVNKAIKPCGDLKAFANSCGLNSDKPSENGHKDAIDCMLQKLKDKIGECKKNHAQTGDQPTKTPCHTPSPSGENSTLDVDEEDTENKVEKPAICGDMGPTQQQDEGEEDCKPSDTIQEVKDEKPKAEEDSGTVVTPEESSKPSPAPSSGDDNPETPQDKAPAPVPESPAPPAAPTKPLPSDNTSDILKTTIPFGIALALTSIALLFLKKKTKSSIGNLFQILQIPKSDYDIPTKLSPNRYIPYTSGKYRGKRYIYLEGDSGTDSGYTDHYSDITSSSESEYEELDINDIYVPGSPKYKTLIEVVLEPSGKNTTASAKNTPSDTQNDIQNDDIPINKFTDEEWNQLKHDFISNMLQSQPKDVPNDYKSGDIPMNTQPNTLYFDNNQEKPFITSIHDRNLYSGEEYNYDMSNNSGIYPSSSNRDSLSGTKVPYSGMDLINDSLSGNEHIDIYDEVLKRKENELFGTNHVKHTTINRVAKPARDDPIHNQLELFHKWLDRHRDMCEKWENHHERLAKLKEEWENETHSGDINSGIPSDRYGSWKTKEGIY